MTTKVTSQLIASLTSSQVTTALGFTPYNSTNPSGYLVSITSGQITTALGFTPYNSTNPSGYLTSSTGVTSVNGNHGAITIPIIGTTWTSFTQAQRDMNTTYTNNTGKIIQVFPNFGCNYGGNGQFYVDGNLISWWGAQFNGCGGRSTSSGNLVPPGSTYSFTGSGGWYSWWELI
jgi:hypothetical protein